MHFCKFNKLLFNIIMLIHTHTQAPYGKWPSPAARCRGVEAVKSAVDGSAPASNKRCTQEPLLALTAQCSAVLPMASCNIGIYIYIYIGGKRGITNKLTCYIEHCKSGNVHVKIIS